MYDLKCTERDLRNLPNEMKDQEKFCLWRYEPSESSTGKPKKVPYTWCLNTEKISRNFPRGTFLSFLALRLILVAQKKLAKQDQVYLPGFYLKDSNLSVIDIDNYHPAFGLGSIVARLNQKGCYVESSPSGQGLHIFYSGSLDWTNGRKRSYSSLKTDQAKETSCEVYGPNDVRYITLTGLKITTPNESDPLPLPEAGELQEEFQELKNLFFLSPREQTSVSYALSSSISCASTVQYSSSLPEADSRLELVLSKIKDSVCHFLFLQFVNCLKFDKHNSISETDMAFAGFISAYIPDEWPYSEKIDVMVKFFHSYRPQRDKTRDRLDYVRRTAQKALQSGSFVKSKSEEKSKGALDQKHSKSIASKSILKICNIMQIFHLGKSYENFKYIENKNKDNSLEATCPESLTPTDFKYFMQLLFQYKESKLFTDQNTTQKNGYYEINIKKLGEELGIGIDGRSYKRFFNSLSKLSKVHLNYNKLIDRDKKLYCSSGESLLSYRASYETHSGKDNRSYKRLEVRMHSAISEILSMAEYNYSLINKESYSQLSSEKSQLLYVYFCQKTLPGKKFTIFTLEDLLDLWPASNDRRTVYSRIEQLISLIADLVSKQDQLKDLDLRPVYENGKLIMVKVKKNKLIPVSDDN